MRKTIRLMGGGSPFVEQRGDAFQIREHDWKY